MFAFIDKWGRRIRGSPFTIIEVIIFVIVVICVITAILRLKQK